jgi:Tfp pilus assembly protein PilP
VELNQLKLVAITTRSGAGLDSALASFEDGAGASYIIRRGDRIGRRQGRVVDITPDTVTVEEAAPSPGAPPRVTEIKLSAAAASSEAAAVFP